MRHDGPAFSIQTQAPPSIPGDPSCPPRHSPSPPLPPPSPTPPHTIDVLFGHTAELPALPAPSPTSTTTSYSGNYLQSIFPSRARAANYHGAPGSRGSPRTLPHPRFLTPLSLQAVPALFGPADLLLISEIAGDRLRLLKLLQLFLAGHISLLSHSDAQGALGLAFRAAPPSPLLGPPPCALPSFSHAHSDRPPLAAPPLVPAPYEVQLLPMKVALFNGMLDEIAFTLYDLSSDRRLH